MDIITFPIEPENIGDAVANLQDGLQLMMDRVRSGLQRELAESQVTRLPCCLINVSNLRSREISHAITTTR